MSSTVAFLSLVSLYAKVIPYEIFVHFLEIRVTDKNRLLLGRIAVLRRYVDAAYCYQPSSVVCRSV